MTFTVRTDRRLIRPTYRSNRFVLVELVAPATRREHGRPPVHLAFVIDRSGSMAGDKLRLAKQAVVEAIARLQPEDRFAVVVYDEHVDVLVPTTHATADARREAVARLAQIEPRGSTDLGGGWLRGCEQVALALTAEGVNRCLLLTDGLANHGITDHDELTAHASELRARGVSTTTFGVGVDFDERLLADLADAGGGHFYYISDAAQIRDAITSEVGETLEVVARDVTLEVMARDEIEVEPITPHKVARRGGRTDILLGDLGSEQVVEVVLRVTFPYGALGHEVGAILTVGDRDGVFGTDAQARLSWTYADTPTNDHQPRDREVDRVVARMFAARATQEAVRLNRSGAYQEAGQLLASTAKRIRSYANRDSDLLATADALAAQSTAMEARMAEPMLKQAYYASANVARSRSMTGQALKADKRM